MRLNALAPLADESTVLRDLYEAQVGVARGVGPLRVRDIAIAHGTLAAVGSDASYTLPQVDGALESIHAETPQAIQTLTGVAGQVARLQTLLGDRTGRSDSIDLAPLRAICSMLAKACAHLGGAAQDAADGDAQATDGTGAAAAPAAARGEIRTRQDALQTLDRVIRFLEQTEPGNPAPLLITRAKKLIGVSFLEIMADLAPNALDTIETVTGKQTTE